MAPEGDAGVPVEVVSNCREGAARTLRPKLTARLATFAQERPTLTYCNPGPFAAYAAMSIFAILTRLFGVCVSIQPQTSQRFVGCSYEACPCLEAFIASGLAGHAKNRNEPGLWQTSQLSPSSISDRSRRSTRAARFSGAGHFLIPTLLGALSSTTNRGGMFGKVRASGRQRPCPHSIWIAASAPLIGWCRPSPNPLRSSCRRLDLRAGAALPPRRERQRVCLGRRNARKGLRCADRPARPRRRDGRLPDHGFPPVGLGISPSGWRQICG